jgi:hypothetical protein
VRHGAAALLAARRAHHTTPPLGADEEDVLVLRLPATSEVTIEPLSPELAAVLRGADAAPPVETLIRLARGLGADAGEASEVLNELAAAFVLV